MVDIITECGSNFNPNKDIQSGFVVKEKYYLYSGSLLVTLVIVIPHIYRERSHCCLIVDWCLHINDYSLFVYLQNQTNVVYTEQ